MFEDNEPEKLDKESALFMRLARQEEWSKQTERRVQIVEEQNKSLSKVASAIEMMQRLEEERQKRQQLIDQQQQIQTERLATTLDRLNGSFNNMNESMQQLYSENRDISHKLDNIESDVAGVKVDVNRVSTKVSEMEQEDTVNLPRAFKKAAGWFFAAITTGVAGYVLITLGLK